MDRPRVLGIFLDGYEVSLERSMRAEGALPNLEALASRGCRVSLDHGADYRTGLSGEHVSTGRSAEAVDRYAAVEFDPRSYTARQVGNQHASFVRHLEVPSVVFDVPYFDLAGTPSATGVVGWGAHDPGVPLSGRPAGLVDELDRRFGGYPAPDFIYATPWASAAGCEAMGRSLAAAVDVRSEAAEWLLADRLPDWRFALVGVSEAHSGIEGLWHGVDPDHRLAGIESAAVAGEGVRAIYRAIDALVGRLVERFPDAAVVVFSMHGMGSNSSDVASMALLPELLHRHAFGRARLKVPRAWRAAPGRPPAMAPDVRWTTSVMPAFGDGRSGLRHRRAGMRRGGRRRAQPPRPDPSRLGWMPATRYVDAWPAMPAFALPSFYDGRVRVNLAGREATGRVPLADYDAYLDELELLVRSCTDPATGRPGVKSVERTAARRGVDPTRLGPTEADLVITWNGPLALEHPRHGLVGPLPLRRTGGHTSPTGSAVIAGPGVGAGDLGTASSYDVVPTMFRLLGIDPPDDLSGTPLRLPR